MRRLARIGLLVAFVVAVLFPPARLLVTGELSRYRRLRAELGELRQRTEARKDEVFRLRAQVRALKSDRRAVETIARDELGLVRPGEVVLEFLPHLPHPSGGGSR